MSDQVRAAWIVTPIVPGAIFSESFLVFDAEKADFWKQQHGFEVVPTFVNYADASESFFSKLFSRK